MNFKLWLSLLAMLVVPSVYTTLRLFFLNTAPDTSSLNIAAQSAWLGLIYEAISEALLVPLCFIFGQVIHQAALLRQRVSLAFVLSLAIYAVATLAIWLFTDALLQTMWQQESERELASRFIRLEALAFMVGTLNDICLIVLTALSMHRWILVLVLARALLTIIFDAFFVSQLPWSLQLGVLGVAFTNLAVGALLFALSFSLLRRLRLIAGLRQLADGAWVNAWLKIAAFSGLESGLRNAIYALVVLRLINQTGAAPLYWNANQILWSWMLLPVLALGQVVRQDAANSQGRLGPRQYPYALLLAASVALWFASQPAWDWFIRHVLGAENPAAVHAVLSLLLPFYAVFSVTHMLQSYLYGMGRTDLIFYQSIVVNIGYYGSVMLLLGMGQPALGLASIGWIFGGGMCVSLCITLWQFQRSGYFRQGRRPALPFAMMQE